MICISDGELLSYLDRQLSPQRIEQAGAHLSRCPRCRLRLARLQADQERVASLLDPYQAAILDSGRNTPESRLGHGGFVKDKKFGNTRGVYAIVRRYQGLIAIAAAAVVLAVLFTYSPVRSLAGQMLQVFRVNRVEVLHFDPADVQQLENAMQTYDKNVDVASFGTFTHEQLSDCSLVDSNTVAIDAQQVTIPAAIGAYVRSGQLQLNQGEMLMVTPKVEGINSFLTSLGSKSLLPASLDGKTFTIRIPGSVEAAFAQPGAASQLTLVRAPSPTMTVPGGVDVQEVRDALLAVPILPEGIRNTLGGIDLSSIYSGTLMIPDFGIDSRGGSIQQITVNGSQGVLITPPQSPVVIEHFAARTGKPAIEIHPGGNALIWPQGGVWNCLQGSFTSGQAAALAAALR